MILFNTNNHLNDYQYCSTLNSVIALVRTFAFTPTKKDTNRAYSFTNENFHFVKSQFIGQFPIS